MSSDVTAESSRKKPQQGQRQLSCGKWSSDRNAYVSDNLCSLSTPARTTTEVITFSRLDHELHEKIAIVTQSNKPILSNNYVWWNVYGFPVLMPLNHIAYGRRILAYNKGVCFLFIPFLIHTLLLIPCEVKLPHFETHFVFIWVIGVETIDLTQLSCLSDNDV